MSGDTEVESAGRGDRPWTAQVSTLAAGPALIPLFAVPSQSETKACGSVTIGNGYPEG
jgi:hypothetical protein